LLRAGRALLGAAGRGHRPRGRRGRRAHAAAALPAPLPDCRLGGLRRGLGRLPALPAGQRGLRDGRERRGPVLARGLPAPLGRRAQGGLPGRGALLDLGLRRGPGADDDRAGDRPVVLHARQAAHALGPGVRRGGAHAVPPRGHGCLRLAVPLADRALPLAARVHRPPGDQVRLGGQGAQVLLLPVHLLHRAVPELPQQGRLRAHGHLQPRLPAGRPRGVQPGGAQRGARHGRERGLRLHPADHGGRGHRQRDRAVVRRPHEPAGRRLGLSGGAHGGHPGHLAVRGLADRGASGHGHDHRADRLPSGHGDVPAGGPVREQGPEAVHGRRPPLPPRVNKGRSIQRRDSRVCIQGSAHLPERSGCLLR
ncbi:unnamed protein product, partial [Heterosigma akashiwo]